MTSISRPPRNDAEAAQPQFGRGCHDGVQYHFFCGDKFFSVRVVETRSLRHHSAWLFDGGTREIVNSSEPLDRSGEDHLDLRGARFEVAADEAGGSVRVRSEGARPVFEVTFTSPVTFKWPFPKGAATHQPLLQSQVTYDGRTYSGLGYCKRYWYDEDIGYWGWRFIQGEADQRRYMLWTADATFGHWKYDYFKIARPDGRLAAAGPLESFHRDDAAYGVIAGTRYEVRIEEIGVWETVLRSSLMETKLRQRFCRMTVTHDGTVDTGLALNETGFGTAW
jgi:hypothetical protein